ncbi:MAG TPA: hypothetical protein VFK79_05900 [Xanthobacteraceae bacterium]|nr:hypothetical protein [Xanthobacteraceae bacterium]
MIKGAISLSLAMVAGAMLAGPAQAQAQVRDAEYRGTLVCGKLPFAQDPGRAAITVKLTGSEGPYERPVHMPVRGKIVGQETGKVKVDGDKIAITGGWKGEKSSYEASYSGTFVRRSAKLTGQQSWTHDGKSYTRTCSGAITRPLAAFLPKPRKPAQ